MYGHLAVYVGYDSAYGGLEREGDKGCHDR